MKDVIIKTVNDEKMYKCPYCGKESRYGQRMQSHMHNCKKLYYQKREFDEAEKRYRRQDTYSKDVVEYYNNDFYHYKR